MKFKVFNGPIRDYRYLHKIEREELTPLIDRYVKEQNYSPKYICYFDDLITKRDVNNMNLQEIKFFYYYLKDSVFIHKSLIKLSLDNFKFVKGALREIDKYISNKSNHNLCHILEFKTISFQGEILKSFILQLKERRDERIYFIINVEK